MFVASMESTVTEENSIKDFEKNLDELESIVEKLESGDLSLEDALKYFEKGIKKTQSCQQALNVAEQRVNVLVENNGNLELQKFQADESEQ